jgi:hypothetical protein
VNKVQNHLEWAPDLFREILSEVRVSIYHDWNLYGLDNMIFAYSVQKIRAGRKPYCFGVFRKGKLVKRSWFAKKKTAKAHALIAYYKAKGRNFEK